LEDKMTDYQDNSDTPATPPRSYYPGETSTLAVISLISGIVAWFFLPLVGAVVAIFTGHMAKSEIRKNPGYYTGDGFATAGLVLGYIQLALVVLSLCLVALLIVGGVSIPVCLGPLSNWQ
jgi:hypothetical protein